LIKIEPLTEKKLEEAINLVVRVFPYEVGGKESPSCDLSSSLCPEQYKDYLARIQVVDARYWLAIDEQRRIVGITGLYHYKFDEEAIWLDWFCVALETRRLGVGTKLLQFSIERAKQEGEKLVRLWSSRRPNEFIAQRMYEKRGFKLIREELSDQTGVQQLYYELRL